MNKTENASGDIYYTIDGLHPGGAPAVFAVTKTQLEAFKSHQSYVPLIQLMNIVSPGLIMAAHAFRGLKRPLLYGNDQEGDKRKLVYTWKAQHDYDWEYGKRFDPSGITKRQALHGRIYAVSATPNNKAAPFDSVDYWIDRWYWLHEDSNLAGVPVDWSTRYEEKLSLK